MWHVWWYSGGGGGGGCGVCWNPSTGFMSDALLEDQSACVVVWCAAGQ